MKEKILIVDDDPGICEILEFNLKSEGYAVDSTRSAEQALGLLDSSVSLILLDVMMGGMSGYKMMEQIRGERIKVPVIFLTAKDTENDMLTGFSVGADDYISKPFSIKEVIARIKAVLQRCPQDSDKKNQEVMEFEGGVINFSSKEVILGDIIVDLTKTEYAIMELLAQSPQHLFPRVEIIEKVWGEGVYITERTVDVHIARLRKKLGSKSALISNRPGFGYKFEIK